MNREIRTIDIELATIKREAHELFQENNVLKEHFRKLVLAWDGRKDIEVEEILTQVEEELL